LWSFGLLALTALDLILNPEVAISNKLTFTTAYLGTVCCYILFVYPILKIIELVKEND